MVAQSASVHFKHPEGGFLFVNANHPDDVKRRSTQRSIRSHSIRGAFRGRQGRKRKPQAVTYALEEVYADWGTCRDQITREQFPIQKSLDSWPFPSKLNNRAQELIYFMNAESDYVFRPFRTVWFSLALTDATAFQLCMANAAMFMAQRKRPDTFQFEKCSEALEYYGHCLRQVTKRLECRDDCTSEGVIVTVLGLICHDMYVGSRTRWATHIRGLHRIIQLRGGHQNIKSNLALWASWYDVLGSATDDTYPYFPEYMDNYLPSSLPLRTPLLKHIICKLMQEDYVSMHPIINALDRVRVIADTVNSRHHEPEFWRREDDLSPLHMIGPVTHILLSIPRLSPETDILDSNKLFREMARLCMLILLTSLKRLYSFALDEIEFTTLTAKFSSVLSIYRRSPSLYQSDDALHRLQLWTILIVASLQPFVDRTPYVTEIRRCMNYMGIASATDAFQLSRDIAWIEVVCGTISENESLFNAIDNATHP